MPLFLLIKGTVWTVLCMGTVSVRVVLHTCVVRYKTALNVGSQALVHRFCVLSHWSCCQMVSNWRASLGRWGCFAQMGDGWAVALWWFFVCLLCAWGWAVSELCWQCRMEASAAVMERCDKCIWFIVTVFVALVFHHHFCHLSSVAVQGVTLSQVERSIFSACYFCHRIILKGQVTWSGEGKQLWHMQPVTHKSGW